LPIVLIAPPAGWRLVRALVEQIVDRTNDVAASVMNHALAEEGELARGRLDEIAAPTLVIHGTADPLFPYGHAEALVGGIPRAKLPPLHEGGFTAFCHRPTELRAEMGEAGLAVMDLVSVEGPAFILGDLDARMADPIDRSVTLEVSRAIERVPELVGFGPHLIATGIRL
jgi:hypothetical protein